MSDQHPTAPRDDRDDPLDSEDTTVDETTAYDDGATAPEAPAFTGAHAETPADRERISGRHPVNVGHLVMGLAFLCFVGAWALIQTDVVTGEDIRWLLPVPWVVAGAVGLAAIAFSGARRHSGR